MLPFALVRPSTFRFLPIALGLALAPACSQDGGYRHAAKQVSITVEPRTAEMTAGTELALGFTVRGTTDRHVRWRVMEPGGGEVSPGGVYKAPLQEGLFHVMVQSQVAPEAMDVAEARVHPLPVARSLKADPARIRAGASVVLTPEFTGGTGRILPGSVAVTSGSPVTVTPGADTTYTLVVTNALGATASAKTTVEVVPATHTLPDISAPAVARVGNLHVAWFNRANTDVEWSSGEVEFLGARTRPTAHVVLFRAKPGVSTYRLEVKARGVAGEAAAEARVFTFQGKVVRGSGLEPVLQADQAFLTRGKACKVRVNPARPGATYRWTVKNGTLSGSGPEVTVTAGDANHLLVTCEDGLMSTTAGLMILDPPDPPQLKAGETTVAGAPQGAFVLEPQAGVTYDWEMDPAQGSFAQDRATAAGPLVTFTVRRPGPFTLRCRAANLAGDVSAPTALTLTAVPYSLEPPRLAVPARVRAGAGPHAAEVVDPVPGQTYAWTALGAALASADGPQVAFTPQADHVLLACTARNPVTGATSTAAETCAVVAAPSVPTILAPATVAPSTAQVAGLLHGGRPGETYAWTLAPQGTLSGGAGAAVAFISGPAPGAFVLTCVATNLLGDHASATFTGNVAVPPDPDPVPSGGGAPPPAGGTPAPGPGSTPAAGGGTAVPALRIAYASGTLKRGVPVAAIGPIVTHAVLPLARFELRGALPSGLAWDSATGVISGTPDRVEIASISVEVVDGGGNKAETDPVSLVVSDSSALGLSYPGTGVIVCRTRERLTEQVPSVANAAPLFGLVFTRTGDLPPGLHFDTTTGGISGVPRVPGTYPFRITARNWDRTGTADLVYQVDPGPAMTLRYDDFHFDDNLPIGRDPAIANDDPEAVSHRYVLLTPFTPGMGPDPATGRIPGLPPGLDLDPGTGRISGVATHPGSYAFSVSVTAILSDGTSNDSALSPSTAYTVVPFVPLGGLTLAASVNPLAHDQDSTHLSWTFAGLPSGLSLRRNLLARLAGGARASSPDLDPEVPLAPGASGADVTVTRRQAYTLTAQDRPGSPDQVATISLARRSLEVVAGDPGKAHPAPEYGDSRTGGAPREGRWRNVKGLAAHGGDVIISEGPDATLRRIAAVGGVVERLAGSYRLPDHGASPDRFANPGPMAVANGVLLICDNGTHTIKAMPPDGSAAPVTLAGTPGPAAPAPAPQLPPTALHPGLPAEPVTTFGGARFGTLTGIAEAGGFAFVADLEHGVRVLDFVHGQTRLLAPESAPYTHPLYGSVLTPRLRRPVAIAAARLLLPPPIGAHRWFVFVATEKGPQWDLTAAGDSRDQNGVIQVLASDRDDPVNALWTLKPFAGRIKSGYEDGPGSSLESGARFRNPAGLLVANGELLVADRDNHCLRTVAIVPDGAGSVAAGQVGTVAGALARGRVNAGFQDDPEPLKARFNRPSQLAAGAAPGTFWVADQDEHMIRRVHLGLPGGVTSLGAPWTPTPEKPWADHLKGHEARFLGPRGIAVEQSTGDAYVVDAGNNCIRRVALRGLGSVPSGAVGTFAGSPKVKEAQLGPEPLAGARFKNPTEIAMDGSARMFVLEDGGSRIKMIDNGRVLNVLDPVRGGAGVHIAARGRGPLARTNPLDPPDAQAMVAFCSSPAAPAPTPRPGAAPAPLAEGAYAAYLAANPGGGPWRVTLCRITGTGPAPAFAMETVADGLPHGPQSLAIGRDNRVHVVLPDRDQDLCMIHTYREGAPGGPAWIPDGPPFAFGPGVAANVPGLAGRTAGGFPEIEAAAVDSRGNLFLADAANGAVWVLREGTRTFECAAGLPGVNHLTGAEPGQALASPLLAPRGLAVTPEDDLALSCGDAIVQVTAPLLPYREALPNPAWTTQAAHNPRAGGGAGASRGPSGTGSISQAEAIANTHFTKGLALVASHPAGALERLEKYLGMAEKHPEWKHFADAIKAALPLWAGLGDQAQTAGNADLALEHYRKYVKFGNVSRIPVDGPVMGRIRPLAADGLVRRGDLARLAGDVPTARECYEDFLRIPGMASDPRRVTVKSNLDALPK
ncbi:putative Ig domain-containing protein [Geothrix sp. 21YS21S-2]|uniref:putative Ig domain-containing protein n=1 Tax=Geothrix sp. 21YS21S-2 TaxID=3068893 RepID=UPI0027B8B8F2|nr:putative Ig domain-containing protein [Geothrix sp. 21YS21S-2]